MEKRKILPWLFGTLGAMLAAAALVVCLTGREAEPVMVRYPQEAEECAGAMMDALCGGDFRQASRYLYGTPVPDAGAGGGDEADAQLWTAFASSLRCTPESRCYATAGGVAQDITVSSLNIGQVLQTMKTTAPLLLEQQIARAGRMDEVYNADHEYREEFLQDVMRRAAAAALETADTVAHTLTVNLTYCDGQWWVVPDQALLEAVSGGILE